MELEDLIGVIWFVTMITWFGLFTWLAEVCKGSKLRKRHARVK